MTAIGDQSPEGRDAKQARCDSTRAPVPNGQSPNPQPVSEADLDALVERYERWLMNTGFDGGPQSPPMLMLGAVQTLRNQLTASEARERTLREALEPFAKEAKDDDGCLFSDDAAVVDRGAGCMITFAHLRRARTALTNTENHHHG